MVCDWGKMFLYIIGLFFCILEPVFAKTEQLSLPRFASIRARKANLHVGPGAEYPSEWTYTTAGLPVEIIAEFDIWRQVRDPQGTTGWIQKNLLCGKRTAIVQEKRQKIFKDPDKTSKLVAQLDPGVVAKVLECRNDWCKVDVQGHKGWINRRCIWGVYPHETTFK